MDICELAVEKTELYPYILWHLNKYLVAKSTSWQRPQNLAFEV
jgi:hypothetical protein